MARGLLSVPAVVCYRRRVPNRAHAAAGLVLAMSGCILYTKPINSPPVVSIRSPGLIYRGQIAVFTATASDPDHDMLELDWAHFDGPCPAPTNPLRPPVTFDFRGTTYPVSPSTASQFCVWVVARDEHGAIAVANAQAMRVNHAPIAHVDVQQPARNASGRYDLFSRFVLSAAGSRDDDGDTLGRLWKVENFPPSTTATLPKDPAEGCSPTNPKNMVQCFVADVDGTYVVSLRVDDGQASGLSDPFVVNLAVDPDRPPCIDDTEPAFLVAPTIVIDPDKDRRFEVRHVSDDGDPYPAGDFGRARFSWSVRHGSGAWDPIEDYELNAFTLPKGTFGIGESGKLRVEARDRHAGDVDRSLAPCGDSDLCALRPGCYQRVTWNLEAR